jgi:hypothetical protein
VWWFEKQTNNSYGEVVKSFPNPNDDLDGFLVALAAEEKKSGTPQVWDPIGCKLKPWISVKKARSSYKPMKCSIM